jgi:hypothetical protein
VKIGGKTIVSFLEIVEGNVEGCSQFLFEVWAWEAAVRFDVRNVGSRDAKGLAKVTKRHLAGLTLFLN